jgi:diguanylate cyclase (GGDEF)-like protein
LFSEHGLEKKILPFLMGLIVAITAILLYLGHAQHVFVLRTLAEEEKDKTTRIYRQLIASLYEKYTMIGENLLINPELVRYVAEKEHDKLLRLTGPLFKKLQQDNPNLEIMHFHTADNHSLLRLHRPDTFGDDLSKLRPMIKKCNDTGKIQVGLEVGKYGISYRIALPIKDENAYNHLGVLEFGIKAEYIVAALKKQFDIDSAMLLQSKNLRTFFTYSPKRDDFIRVDGMVVYTTTLKNIINKVDIPTVRKNYELLSCNGSERLVFQGADLKNFNHEAIGHIILIKDMGFYTRKIDTLRVLSISLALFLLLVSYVILKYSYRRFTRKIDLFQQRLLQKNKTLTKLSSVDHLTKASNRRKIEDILYSEYKILKRYGRNLSLILLDVDDFKHINDTYGHNIGDKVLRMLSKLIASSIRESDFFGRWGGEEFLIVVPNTGADNATLLADKLRRVIANHPFDALDGVTCSFGVAECGAEIPVKTSIKHADDALYQAKAEGKNRVVTWDNTL